MMSPDTVSSLFPDRPIRPLPKRRLRERLSPEAAESIQYPTTARHTVPLFHYPPYALKEGNGHGELDLDTLAPDHTDDNGGGSSKLQSDNFVLRTVEGEGYPSANTPTSSQLNASNRPVLGFGMARPSEQQYQYPPLSAASSIDGYDSFENTNNKKKRKIPSAGDSLMSGNHALGADLNAVGLSNANISLLESNGLDRAYTGGAASPPGATTQIASNQGFSGPGRGRLGRSQAGRSPLRALPDGNNTWPLNGARASQGSDSGGIISSAIANAGKLPPLGQENISIGQQKSASAKTSPGSTQFTFTCGSQMPGTFQWPGYPPRQAASETYSPENGNGEASANASTAGPNGRQGHSRQKSRRRLEKELAVAARHRRQAAADNYKHSPPSPQDVWICEFCEYERIFGEPPRALLRNYEIKDRRHRQDEADRKRVMEKAKAKSRKSKKSSSKGPSKSSPGGNQHLDHGQADYLDDRAPRMNQSQSHSTQSQEDSRVGHSEGYPQTPEATHLDATPHHQSHHPPSSAAGADSQNLSTAK